jgi:phage/plasmid-like protein (TIGR03299 family)
MNMAHNLFYDENTHQHSFFSVKEKAWHGLGKIVDQYPTSTEALEFAGLNYTVTKEDLFTASYNMDGQLMDYTSKVKSHYATMRKDTGSILGVVGKDYEIVQNADAFAFFDSIVGGDGIQYETAGALGQGEKIFITAKLPGYIRVGNDDLTEKYLFLTTSHDGYGSITAAFTPIRIVCNNTLNAALRNQTNCIKIRHTVNAKERLEQAHKLMGISNNMAAQMEEIFNRWAKVRISDTQVRKLIQKALISNKEVLQKLESGNGDQCSTYYKNVCDNAFQYAMANETQQMETTKGTLFGAYNSITGYYQNVRKYKHDTAKIKSLLYNGTGHQRGQAAFDLCQSFEINNAVLNN